MKLTCDLCGNILTEIDGDHAICHHCGMEYGPDRLQELRGAMLPSDPVPPAPEKPIVSATPFVPEKPPVQEKPFVPEMPPVSEVPAAEPEPKQQQKSGCGTWFLIIMAILDLVVGTHGIVAAFCLIIVWIMSRFSSKK